MEQRIDQAITSQALVLPGEHVIVAVSGGADSMALLAALLALRGRLGITVSAAHFHHGLRGQEADRDAAFVESWCAAQGIACRIGYGDTRQRAAETGESIEEAARALRYAFLDALDADRIATAHTADDNAETVLLHLLRGTGLRGMAGIPPRRGRYIRPLLGCTRAEVEAYLRETGTPHIEDSSNLADDCVRNRLRHRVLPLLTAENPRFSETLARSCETLRQEDAFLSALARQAEADARDGGGWRCYTLLSLDPVLRRRVLLGLLRGTGAENPSQTHIDALERLLSAPSPSASCTLPGGWIARRENARLLLEPAAPPRICPSTPLTVPGVTVLAEIGLRITADVTENSDFRQKNHFTFALRYDMMSQDAWSVRARQTGDTLRLPGGSRSLKKLLIDRKIPAAQRDALPVILCSGRIAAVPGVAVDESFRPVPGKPALLFRAEPLS